jgi:hypothetical protein
MLEIGQSTRPDSTAMKANTLNLCISHVPLHPSLARHVDVMLTPASIAGPHRVVIVPDDFYGPHGSSLSEYGQLIWVHDHLDELLGEHEYIRIFHYRRLVCEDTPTVGRLSANVPWSHVIRFDELDEFNYCFDRSSDAELYNTRIALPNDIVWEYSNSHVLLDLLNFSRFLIEQNILPSLEVAAMLATNEMVPACNLGTFNRSTFIRIFDTIKSAARFVHTPDFVPRPPPQRRTMGFLLERLNSYLLLKHIKQGVNRGTFGHNIIISDNDVIYASA